MKLFTRCNYRLILAPKHQHKSTPAIKFHNKLSTLLSSHFCPSSHLLSLIQSLKHRTELFIVSDNILGFITQSESDNPLSDFGFPTFLHTILMMTKLFLSSHLDSRRNVKPQLQPKSIPSIISLLTLNLVRFLVERPNPDEIQI